MNVKREREREREGECVMNECDKELQQRVDEHRSGGVMCEPSCWCWSALSLVVLYHRAIERVELLEQAMSEVKACESRYDQE